MKNDSENTSAMPQNTDLVSCENSNSPFKSRSRFQKINDESQLSGRIRSRNEDFQVDEIQQFTPSGEGEHVWLKIKKTGENTDWVAKSLAQIAEVPRRDVSFAGMKDRNAITTQWFSVQMPGRDAPKWQVELDAKHKGTIQVLEEHRHDRKLKRGALKGNKFKLTLREFNGTEEELAASINLITEQGVPNYFGAQRFGHGGLNVEKAQKWFAGEFKVKDRNMRGIYLSAARSWIFNHILSTRVADGSWNQAIEGDVYILNGSNSSFSQSFGSPENKGDDNENLDAKNDITQRLNAGDIHVSGALWGRGRLATQQAIADIEEKISNEFKSLCVGLEVNGLKQERRSLRLIVPDLEYQMLDAKTVMLKFTLPAGSFATTVLEELGDFS